MRYVTLDERRNVHTRTGIGAEGQMVEVEQETHNLHKTSNT